MAFAESPFIPDDVRRKELDIIGDGTASISGISCFTLFIKYIALGELKN
jgi:hypothetical protein